MVVGFLKIAKGADKTLGVFLIGVAALCGSIIPRASAIVGILMLAFVFLFVCFFHLKFLRKSQGGHGFNDCGYIWLVGAILLISGVRWSMGSSVDF